PARTYYFQFGKSYLVSDAVMVDWGYDVIGRRDGRWGSKSTPLSFKIANLAPSWASGSGLELYSADNGADFSCPQCKAMNAPLRGDTALDMTADYLDAWRPVLLVEGDHAVLLCGGAVTTAANTDYTAVHQVADLAPASLTDGKPA